MSNSIKSYKTIAALVNLLEDEDKQVSVAAMERLLAYEDDLDKIIAEYQESHSPLLRGRIHQLSNVVNLKRSRSEFIESVNNSSISLWEGLVQINYQFNPMMDMHEVRKTFATLKDRLPDEKSFTAIVEFVKHEDFTFTNEDILGADLYLIEDVLLQRVGAPILLSILLKELAAERNLETSIVIRNGRHCVHFAVDNQLVNPSEHWQIVKSEKSMNLHQCEKLEIWVTILCQLFIAAIVDGQFQNIHKIGAILSKLCGNNLDNLPFPLGK